MCQKTHFQVFTMAFNSDLMKSSISWPRRLLRSDRFVETYREWIYENDPALRMD